MSTVAASGLIPISTSATHGGEPGGKGGLPGGIGGDGDGDVGGGEVGEGGERGDGGGRLGSGESGGGGEGGGGGCEGGDGAQHLVAWLPVSISKYRGPLTSHLVLPQVVAQSGHGHVSPLGMHEPPVDAQQYVPAAHSPTHEVASPAVVHACAQRGYSSAVLVSSFVSQ